LRRGAVDKGRDVLLIEVETDEGMTWYRRSHRPGVAHGSEIYVIEYIAFQISQRRCFWGKIRWPSNDCEGNEKGTVRCASEERVLQYGPYAAWISLLGPVGEKGGFAGLQASGGNSRKVKVYASGDIYVMEDDTCRLVREMRAMDDKGIKPLSESREKSRKRCSPCSRCARSRR
jgi:hypothetical protein